MRKNVAWVVCPLVVLALATGCSEYNDDRGRGDAPTDQQPDKTVKVWPNADLFPNIAALCIGENGVYTTTREAAPEVVANDPNCDEGGELAP